MRFMKQNNNFENLLSKLSAVVLFTPPPDFGLLPNPGGWMAIRAVPQKDLGPYGEGPGSPYYNGPKQEFEWRYCKIPEGGLGLEPPYAYKSPLLETIEKPTQSIFERTYQSFEKPYRSFEKKQSIFERPLNILSITSYKYTETVDLIAKIRIERSESRPFDIYLRERKMSIFEAIKIERIKL